MTLVTSQAAQLLAHTPPMVIPGWAPGVNQDCPVLTERSASAPSVPPSAFPISLILSLAAAQARVEQGKWEE